MNQPIKKKIKETHPEVAEQPFYTLIVDGNNLLEVAFHGDSKVNPDGLHVGGMFQFLLQLKIMLKKKDFQFCYVMWDGDKSGQLRYQYYEDYKANRDKKYEFHDGAKSEYDRNIDNFVKRTLAYSQQKRNSRLTPEQIADKEQERESFRRQRNCVMKYLEELFIRQVIDEETEGDDLIGYYVTHKKPNEKIVIVSGDRDLTQLISESVIVYVPVLNKFVTVDNHVEIMGYRHENVLLKKIITGDSSDNIKGIKGVGDKTFFDLFPEVKSRETSLEEIINHAKLINEERAKEKKKPLKSCENIINRVTDGCQGENIFEVNKKIINLKSPLLTDEAINEMESIMYAPIDPDGRSFENLYELLKNDKIYDLIDGERFGNFFLDFKRLVEKEKKYFEKYSKIGN